MAQWKNKSQLRDSKSLMKVDNLSASCQLKGSREVTQRW
jgi:hypothetical protein